MQADIQSESSRILTKKQQKRLRKAQRKAAAEAIPLVNNASLPSIAKEPSSPNSVTLVGSSSRETTFEPHDPALDLLPGCVITPVSSFYFISFLFPSKHSVCRGTCTLL
jgi:hypothetical protein